MEKVVLTMSEHDIKDCNLLVIAAVEEYAQKHNMKTENVLQLFGKHNVIPAIRSQYAVLHMLDLDEVALFAEDMLKQVSA